MSLDSQLFGRIAVERDLVSAADLEAALARQREDPRPLGEILVAMKLLTAPEATAVQKLQEVLSGDARPPDDDEEELTGLVLGGCLVLDRIGTGSMGVVYRAHHLRLDRDVVVKVLHPRLMAIEGNLERFAREARAAANLEHPGIVQIYDFDTDHGYHFMVMQFVRGQNLRQVLDNRGALGPRRALWIGARVLEGLAHAHSRSIVHRDIKPANLLITPEPRIKIADFGLVRILSLTTSDKISVFGELLGTPQYMAPEQANMEEVDPRTDLYALGVSLFELIAGRPPFSGGSTLEVLEKHIMEPLPQLSDLVEEATPDLQGFLERLCAKAPEERFPDAPQALAALQRLRSSEGVTRSLSGAGAGAGADPSRNVASPPVVSEEALEELKTRLQRSQHLVAFEGADVEPAGAQGAEAAGAAPGAGRELVDASFADLAVDATILRKARRALARAAREGTGERVVPGLFQELLDGGHTDEVIRLEKEAELVLPTSAAAAFFVGLAFERKERLEEARARFSLAAALAPDHLPARLHLARTLVDLKRVDEAVKTLEEANTWHPTSPQAALRLAEVLYVVQGDAEAAIPAYERAIELAPTRWQLRQQLAWILYEQGRYSEAQAVLEEVVAWRQDARPAHQLLARIKAKLTSAPPAENEAGSGGPGPQTSACLDAIRLAEAGAKWKRALTLAEEGLRERPKSVPLLLARAKAQVALGLLSQAVNTYSMALAADPDNVEAQQGLMETQSQRKTQRLKKPPPARPATG